jgi:hypothetical protein
MTQIEHPKKVVEVEEKKNLYKSEVYNVMQMVTDIQEMNKAFESLEEHKDRSTWNDHPL